MCCGNRQHHYYCTSHAMGTAFFEEEIRDLEEYKEMLEMELEMVNAKIKNRKKREENTSVMGKTGKWCDQAFSSSAFA